MEFFLACKGINGNTSKQGGLHEKTKQKKVKVSKAIVDIKLF